MKRLVLISSLLLGAATALGSSSATAREGAVTVTGRASADQVDRDDIRVSLEDLDLATEDDGQALRDRFKVAARRTCGALYDSTTPAQRWACEDVAWDAAAPQIADAIRHARNGQAMAAKALVVRLVRR